MTTFADLTHSRQELIEILVWLYLTTTGQFNQNPFNGKVYFVYTVVDASKREILNNLSLAMKLPVQTLSLIESIVASELADFTIHDQSLSKDLDPRLPNQKNLIALSSVLKEFTQDSHKSLHQRLKPIYFDLVGHVDGRETLVEARVEESQKALNLATSIFNSCVNHRGQQILPKVSLKNILVSEQGQSSRATRHVTIAVPGCLAQNDDSIA